VKAAISFLRKNQHRRVRKVIFWFVGWFVCGFVDWLIGLVGWLVGRSILWIMWSFANSVGWLVGLFVYLVVWLVVCLLGWLVNLFALWVNFETAGRNLWEPFENSGSSTAIRAFTCPRWTRAPHDLLMFIVQTFWCMHAKFLNHVACLFDKDRREPSVNGTGMKVNTVHWHCMPVFIIRHTPQKSRQLAIEIRRKPYPYPSFCHVCTT